MGIPSPLLAPHTSPLMRLKNPMSPELPLQAVQELEGASQACEPLPPSSVDLQSSCGKILEVRPTRTWADTKDSDASDCGDEHDNESESSTDLPRANSESTTESRSDISVSKHNAELNPEVEASPEVAIASPSTVMDVLQEKGVMKMDACSLVPTYTDTGMPSSGSLMQLLCRVWRDGNAGMSIVPCTGDDVTADGEHEVFWCYVEPQMDGNVLISPCTDPASCGIHVDASGTPLDSISDIVGAPERPPPDSHVPMWVYGARWPHTVAPTTLILSNLPNDLVQDDFIEILDKEGYSGFYDFFYLPSDPVSGCNMGYAIVNLTRHEYGLALSALMHGRTSWCGANTLECQVTWSMPLQGLEELVDYFRKHPLDSSVPSDMRPTLFSGGWPRPLPLEGN